MTPLYHQVQSQERGPGGIYGALGCGCMLLAFMLACAALWAVAGLWR